MAARLTIADANCPGCNDREANQLDGCCNIEIDVDKLHGRCVGDWSNDKHHYFSRYVDIFAKGMKKKWKNLAIIDLFAGPGRERVRPGGAFTDGSPLLALKAPITHGFFNDLSPLCANALRARVAAARPTAIDALPVANGDANLVVDDAVKWVERLGESTLALAFLDPDGIELSFETVRRLSSLPRVDLLINFPLGMNLKRQVKHQLEKPEDEDAAFDRYFGTKSWRQHVEGAQFGRRLFDLYCAQLKSLGFASIGDTFVVKSRSNASLYVLIFASKHARGSEFWKKALSVEPSGQRPLF